MHKLWITFKLILLFSCLLCIDCSFIQKGPMNETLIVGRINAPPGDPTRNLIGMILSINVFHKHVSLHNSMIPIKRHTFPLNYSFELNDHDFQLKNTKSFHIVSMIWQPAYVYDNHVRLEENDMDQLDLTMRSIKYVIIRGEIVHENHKAHALPATQIKLELIENTTHEHVIDQVDFICKTKIYPCPFEYWLNTARIRENVNYRLEAVISENVLPARKTAHKKHRDTLLETKSTEPVDFKINTTIDTEINNFKIIVANV